MNRPSQPAPTPRAPISWGELVDKITILEIKSARMSDPEALANVRRELALLTAELGEELARNPPLGEMKIRLRAVNEALWEIEDAIRAKEEHQAFDARFIELARSVYRQNDRRAAIKKAINKLLGSEIVEEKSYKSYR